MRLIKIKSVDQIPKKYLDTPIGKLLEYQNLSKHFDSYDSAQILVGICMDNRKQLLLPENFVYIIRTGGANLRYSEFKIPYAIAIGGVRYVVLIAHDNCGMVNLVSKRQQFIKELCENAGWEEKTAEEHFMSWAQVFETDNEVEFVVAFV